jgi:hypothetical protein
MACRAISADACGWLCQGGPFDIKPAISRVKIAGGSFYPSHISNDHEETGGADGDKGAGHSDPHRNPNDSEVHAGGLWLSVKRFSFPEPSGSITAANICYLSAN